jgi:hypothetical protein
LTQERKLGLSGPSILPKEDFLKNWNQFTGGILDGLDWTNVFAAGGAILACLSKEQEGYKSSDIDLFVYGMDNDEDANRKLKQIHSLVVSNTKGAGEVIRTSRAVTILNSYPYRHVQIILRLYRSPAEVLLGFDIDACTFGFDGRDVWAMERGRRALNKRYNLVNKSRRSMIYEQRLFKYSKRGFAVAVPNLDKSKVDPALFNKRFKELGGLAKLLWYDRKANQNKANGSPNFKKKGADGEEGEVSDYNGELPIPWGPNWESGQIIQMLNNRDKTHFFANYRRAKKEGVDVKQKKHHHMFITGIDQAIVGGSFWCRLCQKKMYLDENDSTGKYVKRPIEWIKNNPAYQDIDNGFKRSLMTGAFNLPIEENWELGAYVGSGTTQVTGLSSNAGGVPASSVPRVAEPQATSSWPTSIRAVTPTKEVTTAAAVPSWIPPNASYSPESPPEKFKPSTYAVPSYIPPAVKTPVATAAKKGGDEKFSCAVCNKTFYSENQKRKHVRDSGHLQPMGATEPESPGYYPAPSLAAPTTFATVGANQASLSGFGPQPGATSSFFQLSPGMQPTQGSQRIEDFQPLLSTPVSNKYDIPSAYQQPRASPSTFNIGGTSNTSSSVSQYTAPQPVQYSAPIVSQSMANYSSQEQSGEVRPTTKLLMLVALCFKQGAINAQEKGRLKDLIIAGNELIYSAVEVYLIDQDLDELVDTFKRICRLSN